MSCPCEASRAISFLAGRSHAAIIFTLPSKRDQPREERSDEALPDCHQAGQSPGLVAVTWARPVSSGLVSFDDFEM